MMRRSQAQQGTVTLVALCFVTVLGISLAGYIALCSRTMQLSNRTTQSGLSQQLAEMGLEEGLRALNKNDWSDWPSSPANVTMGSWSLDTTNKRAARTITFNSGKLSQGATGTIKIRVDNYDAQVLGATYQLGATYRINDLIAHNGIWYRSLQNSNTGNQPADSSQNPDLAWWTPAPIPWTWSSDITYSQYQTVNYSGTWYRYFNSSSTSGNPPTNTSYWVSIPKVSLNWNSTTSYPFGAIVYYSGSWYFSYQRAGSGSSTPTNTSYWVPVVDSTGTEVISTYSTYSAGDTFYVGDYIFRASTGWYRCIAAQPYTYVTSDYADTSKWVSSKPFSSWFYRSTATYNFNDVVYYSGSWYRRNVTSSTTGAVPTNTSYWENALSGSNTTSLPGALGWSSNSIKYNVGDLVYYYASSTSQWFRCKKAHDSATTALIPTNTTYWDPTPPYSNDWDTNRQYSQNDTVRYKGLWFLSLLNANIGNLPMASGSSYWAIAPRTVSAWDATTTYQLDDLVSSSGSWYRCIRPHSNQATSNTGYWTPLTGSGNSYVWSISQSYSNGQYRSYGGVWYKYIDAAPTSGHSPNETAYWTPTWSNSWSVTTGAPVIYAEGTINLGDGTTSKTQLRAIINPARLFPNAAASTTTLTITSGTGAVDSYDGSVRTMNTGGTYSAHTYNDQTNAPFSSSNANIGYSAVLATSSSSSSALTISNTSTIKGYLAQPTPGSSISTNTTVWGPTSPGSPKVDTSRVSRSPYIPQFTPLPSQTLTTAFSSWNFPYGTTLATNPGGTISIGTPGGIAPARYYYNASLTLSASGSYQMNRLNINGPVILYINGNLRTRYVATSSEGTLAINSTGSAEIHVDGGIRSDANTGGYSNLTLDPKRLVMISDITGTTTQYLAAAGNFYGVIYAPNTTATLGLDIRTGVTVYGAVSAKEVTFSTEANLHYDSSLRYATIPGVDKPNAITEWRALPAAELATMP